MDSVKGIITAARRLNPQVSIITRSKFISETSELYHLGADEVIVDERESAIQIFRRILMSKNMPIQDIEQFSKEIRTELYNTYINIPQKIERISKLEAESAILILTIFWTFASRELKTRVARTA